MENVIKMLLEAGVRVEEDEPIKVVDEVKNKYGWFVFDGERIWVMGIITDFYPVRMKDIITELCKKWKTKEVHFTNVVNPALISKLKNAELYLVKGKGDYAINIKVMWDLGEEDGENKN